MAKTTGLLHSNPQFDAFASSINYGIIIGNKEGNIIDFNSVALEMFGYTEAELEGQPMTILMPERFRQRHLRGLAHYNETGKPKVLGTTMKIYAQHKDGHEFPIEIALSSWKSGNEEFFTASIRRYSKTEERVDWIILSAALMLTALIGTIVLMLFKLF